MKKEYIVPMTEVSVFEAEDIITTSGGDWLPPVEINL